MHSGNVGHAQNLDVLVRAATFLRDLDDLNFVIIGSGARQAELIELAAASSTDRVSSALSATGDAVAIAFVGGRALRGLVKGLSGYIVPSRLNGVLSVGRPVIVAADEESEIVARGRDAQMRNRDPARPARDSCRGDPRRAREKS